LWAHGVRRQEVPSEGRAESRAVTFAAVWVLLSLLPFLNLRALPQGEIIHDRYLYLASVGFSILAALALRCLSQVGIFRHRRPAIQLAPALVLAVFLGIGTFTQSLYWADELALYSRSHKIAPENDAATTSLAAAASQRGMYGPAIELYKQVLARHPRVWRANVDLAYAYYSLGRYQDAIRYFARSIEADPVDGNQYLYLGLALAHVGRFKEAEGAIRQALVVRPDGPGYHHSLGIVLRMQGKLPAALEEFRNELAKNPGNRDTRAQVAEIESQLRESQSGQGTTSLPKGPEKQKARGELR
jgi:tetratricopeptide (TPR) repeat protein